MNELIERVAQAIENAKAKRHGVSISVDDAEALLSMARQLPPVLNGDGDHSTVGRLVGQLLRVPQDAGVRPLRQKQCNVSKVDSTKVWCIADAQNFTLRYSLTEHQLLIYCGGLKQENIYD